MRLKDHVKDKARSMTADEASLPALRGVGFTVSRRDRAGHTVQQFDEAALHQAALEQSPPQPANLFAEDVTRGYRVDVEPDGDRFLSLCHRTGTYTLRTSAGRTSRSLVPPDEGYTKASSTDVGSRRRPRSCTCTRRRSRGPGGASSPSVQASGCSLTRRSTTARRRPRSTRASRW